MRWGFLGIGRVTPRMVTAIRSVAGHTIHSVAARDAIKLAEWADRFGVASTTSDFDKLVQDPSIDAVYVALPPSLHATWASQAMQHGKVVLCEKPLTACSLESERLAVQCRTSSSALYHATAFPHHPRSQAMRDIVRSGELGTLSRITIACSFSHVTSRGKDHRTDPDSGGGCLLDLGWYCAFATLWLTGFKALSVRAIGKQLDGPGSVWSSAQALVELENNVTAVWDCGFDAAGRKWLEVAGSDASIVCDDFLRPWDLDKPRFWVHGNDGKARAEIVGAGVSQEMLMIQSISNQLDATATESLELAVSTQQLLSHWETAMITGQVTRPD